MHVLPYPSELVILSFLQIKETQWSFAVGQGSSCSNFNVLQDKKYASTCKQVITEKIISTEAVHKIPDSKVCITGILPVHLLNLPNETCNLQNCS
ncbi:hypothetical protein POPTR_015G069150v4 [Populus trichocarpa]|uniref:Uncharacterized protein n=1 Tax=Populus trichocarpa TaxID=3694 RepID=A0ACC0RVT0_POPTR|nr:hypothetical protein POPTR_015G069150v4 [Populus trichocarpa]